MQDRHRKDHLRTIMEQILVLYRIQDLGELPHIWNQGDLLGAQVRTMWVLQQKFHIQGRTDAYPKPTNITCIQDLRRAYVTYLVLDICRPIQALYGLSHVGPMFIKRRHPHKTPLKLPIWALCRTQVGYPIWGLHGACIGTIWEIPRWADVDRMEMPT